MGLCLGLGLYTFVYARGASYLTNDPAACVNCHVMNDQFHGWERSSHHAVAVCNDCHAPSDFVGKYYTKAENGFHHSLAFTTGRFNDVIRIRARNRAITEQACRRCHQDIVQAIDSPRAATHTQACLDCHQRVGHL